MPRCRGVRLTEAIKDIGQKVRRDPFTRVLHNDQGAAVLSSRLHLDAPISRRVLHSVGKQIPNDLLKPIGISRNWTGRWIELQPKLNALAFTARTNRLDGSFNRRD